MLVRAPGVIKLFGEHAVVYGKRSIAVAVGRHATCSVNEAKSDSLSVDLTRVEYGKKLLSERDLLRIYDQYKNRKSIKDYISSSGMDLEALAFGTMAARLMKDCGLDVFHETVLESNIPFKAGMASSAAAFTAFTCALVGDNYKSFSDSLLIDIARDGERVAHCNEGAGGIDISTSFYGGYVNFASAQGALREDLDTMLDLIIVNTGPKKSTSETVGHVAELYKSDRERTTEILDEIDECSCLGKEALERGDCRQVGALMFRNHELLRMLEVSSANLDKVVDLSKTNGALGAKLSGGGGGGIAVVLSSGDDASLIGTFKENSFDAFKISPAFDGAVSFLK